MPAESRFGHPSIFGRNAGGSTSSTVTISSNPPGYLTPRVSTSGSYDVLGSAVPLTGGQATFSIPGSSVFTLLSAPGSGSGSAGGAGGMGGQGGAGNGGSAGASAGQGGQSGAGAAGAGAGGQSGSGGASGAGAGGAGSGGMSGSGGTGGSPSTLVAGWAFDEGTGTTTADASGHGHTGTLVSSPAWTTTGCKYGNCLSFTSTGKRVTVPDANDLDLGTTWTLMAWIKPSTTSGWRPVMLKEGNSANLESYLFYAIPGNTGGGYTTDANNTEFFIQPSATISTSVWSHIAFMRNTNILSYWVNGSQIGSTTISSVTTKASTGQLDIGGHPFWNGEWYAGLLDDVRIYSAALSSSEISSAMNSGL